MKKIILIILVINIVCYFSLENTAELEDSFKGLDFTIIEKIWNKMKIYIDKAVNFLKQIGLYDPIIANIQKYGRAYGMKYCISFKIPEGVCKDIIDILLKFIK